MANLSKGLKIAIGVAVVGVTGVAVFYIVKAIRKANERRKQQLDNNTSGGDSSSSRPSSSSSSSSSTSSSSSSVPFKNNTEGNKFRAWVNDNYPKYAKEIDLDRTGSYNNSFVQKAYEKYGNEYEAFLKKIKVNDYVLVTTRNKQTTFYGDPISQSGQVNSSYARGVVKSAPAINKYKVRKVTKDGATGEEMAYIFNKADISEGYKNGTGFKLYTKYLEKTTF